MNWYLLAYILQKVVWILILLILPILPIFLAIDISIDLVSLQNNCINLIAAAGTMATLSLAFLFERIEALLLPLLGKLSTRILAINSILYFLFASLAGLIYLVLRSNIICLQILFWYTLFGISCLIVIGFIIFVSGEVIS